MDKQTLVDRFYYDPIDITFPLVYKNIEESKGKSKNGRAGYYKTDLRRPGGKNNAYCEAKIHGKSYKIHRLVWIYFNDEIEESFMVDHGIGGILDNRIENLQSVSNSKNKRIGTANLYKNNISGMTGVLYDSKLKKWKVSFRCRNKLYYFGVYKDLKKAKEECMKYRKIYMSESRR